LNIACSGQGVVGSKEDWAKFAGTDGRFREGMERLYDLFCRAPELGSLINPRTVAEDLFALGFDTLKGTVERALKKIEARDDPDQTAVGVAAQGIALAASLMTREFNLVATNVPYLKRGKQAEIICDYCDRNYSESRMELAVVFLSRCTSLCRQDGTVAVVSPQNWLFQAGYLQFRKSLLTTMSWGFLARLGPGAFETISGEIVNVCLYISSMASPGPSDKFHSVDVSEASTVAEKQDRLKSQAIHACEQLQQLRNPDSRIIVGGLPNQVLLKSVASSATGMQTYDSPRFVFEFWEIQSASGGWVLGQTTVEAATEYAGCSTLVRWEEGAGQLSELMDLKHNEGYNSGIWRAGTQFWGRKGVLISLMGNIPACIYLGGPFDNNTAAIVPRNAENLLAIWAFCSSNVFGSSVRLIDQALKVTTNTLEKIAFDLAFWQKQAETEYPDGLPEPHSDDPTQWLFRGQPKGSIAPFQVAVTRLLGYHWPDQEPDDLDALADADGIVPIPSVRGEQPAAERLREVLKAAFGRDWSPSLEHRLQTDAGCKAGATLDDWLRNQFFEQHCKRFHNRPFIWHIWDGRKDGFSALVNYHKLDHKALENLTYSYLGNWITAQSRSESVGADLRLAAAQTLQEKLKRILAGEPPYDIFVRWKPLHKQAIGWQPDLNDGVRMNIRPFVRSGILRKPPNIKWTKDRGYEPQRPQEEYPWFWDGDTFKGERVNGRHYTNAEKQAARQRANVKA